MNEYGNIAMTEWLKTPQIRPYVQLDEFVVMPNHIYGILILTGLGHGTPCPYENGNNNDARFSTELEK